MLNNELDEDNEPEDDDKEQLDEYILCSKCGCIYDAKNINSAKCTCDDSFKRSVYLVNQNRKKNDVGAYNNISKCPCCGITSRAGIVKSLNVGKDEGTAVIAQMLFDSMNDDEQGASVSSRVSLKLDQEHSQTTKPLKKVNQFLTQDVDTKFLIDDELKMLNEIFE